MLSYGGSHVTLAMKLVELNLFVWILYYSWDYYSNLLSCCYQKFLICLSVDSLSQFFSHKLITDISQVDV